jgi:LytS/YehU family sensor histidine kinase
MLASIKSQMNPHFLFNALNTIQAYIYTNDKENASVYLGKFSELTRRILEMSNKDCVPLSEEIKSLSLYLELEKIRFEDLLHYTFEVDPALQPDFVYIPSMLIQPYVENAIKHGLLHKKDDRQLWIKFIKERDCLMVIIDDNGIGRKRSAQLKRLKEKTLIMALPYQPIKSD